jgi:hypothetical protein
LGRPLEDHESRGDAEDLNREELMKVDAKSAETSTVTISETSQITPKILVVKTS